MVISNIQIIEKNIQDVLNKINNWNDNFKNSFFFFVTKFGQKKITNEDK